MKVILEANKTLPAFKVFQTPLTEGQILSHVVSEHVLRIDVRLLQQVRDLQRLQSSC
jgi:hypothetical protein